MKFSSELVPYLLQSVYDWCCDNGLRAMLLVRDGGDSILPRWHVKNGCIVLDISKAAVRELNFGADAVSFEASFDGEPFSVEVANAEIMWIGSPERKIGMVMSESDVSDHERVQPQPAVDQGESTSRKRKKSSARPNLKLI
ncbi:MAG: ClpXP protease specificity-enhancing factor SspB [Betaproteobacteria bacterium]|nr:ClpXP protease specificity-enhancing factor SspB [Betaproteobacteria bacterium]